MKMEGVEDEKVGIILAIPFMLALVVGSIVAFFLIDLCGRRYLILRSSPVIFVALVLVAYSMGLSLFSEDNETK